jgi:hypothetical protein
MEADVPTQVLPTIPSYGPTTAGNGSVIYWNVPTADLPQAYFRVQVTDAP